MPGPPVGTILTSNDIGLGTNEMKVKGTFTLMENDKKFVMSKFLFISPEEEEAFLVRNPEYRKGGFIDINDPGPVQAINSNNSMVNVPIRGRKVAQKAKDQVKDNVLSKGGEVTNPPPKPKVKKK
jgi:hypothetical protein